MNMEWLFSQAWMDEHRGKRTWRGRNRPVVGRALGEADGQHCEENRMSTATGGVINRDYVKRYARRRIAADLQRVVGGEQFQRGYRHAWQELIEWLNQQPKRTKLRGGLGSR
jgi:hypothetical protein